MNIPSNEPVVTIKITIEQMIDTRDTNWSLLNLIS